MITFSNNAIQTTLGREKTSGQWTIYWKPYGSATRLHKAECEIMDYAVERIDAPTTYEIFVNSDGTVQEREVPNGASAIQNVTATLMYENEVLSGLRKYVDSRGGARIELYLVPNRDCNVVTIGCDEPILFRYMDVLLSKSEQNEGAIRTFRASTATRILWKSPIERIYVDRYVEAFGSVVEVSVQAQALHGVGFDLGKTCACVATNCKKSKLYFGGASQTADGTNDFFATKRSLTVGIPSSHVVGREIATKGSTVVIPYTATSTFGIPTDTAHGGLRVSTDCGATWADATLLNGVTAFPNKGMAGVIYAGGKFVAYGVDTIAVSHNGVNYEVVYDATDAGHTFVLADASYDVRNKELHLVGTDATTDAPLHLVYNNSKVYEGALPTPLTSQAFSAIKCFSDGRYAIGTQDTGQLYTYYPSKNDFAVASFGTTDPIFAIEGAGLSVYVAVGSQIIHFGPETFNEETFEYEGVVVVESRDSSNITNLTMQYSDDYDMLRAVAVTAGGNAILFDTCMVDACAFDGVAAVNFGTETCADC